jgi:NTP pyrophosphatase (non-canonical NTP hydrolase)
MNNIRQRIKEYIEERGWTVFKNPGSIAKSISIESAELLEVFQWNEYTQEEVLVDEKVKNKIREELADVLIYATEMAISLDLDIEEIMSEKLEKNIKKYPADVVRGNQEEYLKLKMEHRQKHD